MRRTKKKSADTSTPPSSGKSKTASSSNSSPPETMQGTKERPLYIDESMQNFFTVEEGYGSSDDCELSEDYKSPLAGAPSYHSYLSIVPDDDEEDVPDEGSGCPKPEEPLSSPDSTPLYDNTPASTPSDLPSPGVEIEQNEEERERLRAELAEAMVLGVMAEHSLPMTMAPVVIDLAKELAKDSKVESDILTLRQTLRAKEGHSKEIKRKLGITPMNQMKEDLKHGWQNFQQSNAYNKTKSGLATAGQKTTSAFNTFGSAVSKKLGDMRDSNTFKSFEEKMSSATTSIKTKVGGGKTQESSFDEVLQSTASAEQQNDSHVNSALVPEDQEKIPL